MWISKLNPKSFEQQQLPRNNNILECRSERRRDTQGPYFHDKWREEELQPHEAATRENGAARRHSPSLPTPCLRHESFQRQPLSLSSWLDSR